MRNHFTISTQPIDLTLIVLRSSESLTLNPLTLLGSEGTLVNVLFPSACANTKPRVGLSVKSSVVFVKSSAPPPVRRIAVEPGVTYRAQLVAARLFPAVSSVTPPALNTMFVRSLRNTVLAATFVATSVPPSNSTVDAPWSPMMSAVTSVPLPLKRSFAVEPDARATFNPFVVVAVPPEMSQSPILTASSEPRFALFAEMKNSPPDMT